MEPIHASIAIGHVSAATTIDVYGGIITVEHPISAAQADDLKQEWNACAGFKMSSHG